MKKKLKIGLVFDDSLDSNDGVQQYVKTLGAWLLDNGHDVKFLVGETKAAGEFQPRVHSLSRNIKISGNQNRVFLPLMSSGKKIDEVLRKENFDVLHVMMPSNPLMGSRVIRRAGTTPVVGSFHMVGGTWLINLGASVLSRLQSSTLSRIDKFLSVSSAAYDFERQHFGIKSQISPNMVDIAKYEAGERKKFLRGEKGTLVFLGRMVERKGAQHLLEAVRLLHSNGKFSGILLHMCGDGELRPELEDFVQTHQLSQQVIFHGFIDEKEKPDYLASADIAIYPSTGGEAFGIVLIEAMATGQAVVLGGDNSGYRTVLGGYDELLFDPTNPEDLALKIELYLSHKKSAQEAIDWQVEEVKKYDVNRVGAEIVEIYQEAISAKS